MDDEGWEARMAARARERAQTALSGGPADPNEKYATYMRAERAQLRGCTTLGDAVAWFRQEPWGCACTGPPNCCMDVVDASRAVQAQAQRLANAMRAVAKMGEHVSDERDGP